MSYKSLNFDLNRGLLDAVNGKIRLSAANNLRDYRSIFFSSSIRVMRFFPGEKNTLSEQGPPLVAELLLSSVRKNFSSEPNSSQNRIRKFPMLSLCWKIELSCFTM